MSKIPTRTDWLLRFIAGTELYDGSIDRIRIVKGMFLFQKEAPAPPEVNYNFRPYDYGPFTPEIYDDLGYLRQEGLIAETPTDPRAYRVTHQGRAHLESINFPSTPLDALIETRVEVTDLGFRDLLRRVYKAHPESAARSVAKDVLD